MGVGAGAAVNCRVWSLPSHSRVEKIIPCAEEGIDVAGESSWAPLGGGRLIL